MNLIKEFKKVFLAILSVIFVLSGAVNLKDYSASFSLLDFTFKSFLTPLLWMTFIGIGIYLGGKYIKREHGS